jgi:methionyl-tRNA formyltransferase
MRVLFWGTPEFATPPLRALLGEGFDVAGVVTQPDRPVGRSRSVLHPSPVKQIAVEEGLPVLQPEKPRGAEFEAQLRALAPDISVVVAYGHILPQPVIELPPRGTLNIHASLLPRLRGAAPIQGAILAGDEETGVSIMRMVPRLDAGAVIHAVRTPIPHDETAGELTVRLSELGALALIEAMALLELGEAREQEQDESLATYAPKIERDATRVDWSAPATQVSRVIRAYDPRPGAVTTLAGTEVKLFGARLADGARASRPDARPGEVLAIDGQGAVVACGTGAEGGAVAVAQLQPAGKRRLTALDWSHGRGIQVGDCLA